MRVTHVFALQCRCPVDNLTDTYEVTLTIDRLVKVEQILDYAATFADQTLYQENLTELLAEKFDGKVVTVGTHSGVRTTCTIELSPSESGL